MCYDSLFKTFLQQIELRCISLTNVDITLSNPDNTVIEDGLMIYQKIIAESNKLYLLRIFVNIYKRPPLVVTAYKTSKIEKYYSP
ncbi:MAG: DUF4258 domain-containing protein [Bacteroidota bacterium]|nr:DUF4258 domain-containing protein [Bacteroidota bacterium]